MTKVKFGKWVLGGLGAALGGPLGAILGFAIGSAIDAADVSIQKAGETVYSSGGRSTAGGDFAASLLVLSAAVMKSDGQTMKSELDYVKKFLVTQFGESRALEQIQLLKEILKLLRLQKILFILTNIYDLHEY